MSLWYATVDMTVQAILEEQLEATRIESGAANRVCGIVMDVNTAEVLAMATSPGFDLNDAVCHRVHQLCAQSDRKERKHLPEKYMKSAWQATKHRK